jgi:Kef-type K+ transport system membrane component KefB
MMQVATLLLQIVVILAAIRLFGAVCRAVHQPQVVGEMVAGIMLGPSVLGALSPRLSAFLFPADSMGLLNGVSQFGLVLFLYSVGLEHDLRSLKGHGETAVISSHASIFVPFFLGALLALFLYPRLSDDGITFVHFALFMGIAMSITAFPVLARILEEKSLVNTPVGATAIVCAAVDDVTGWCIVAAILFVVHANKPAFPVWAIAPLTIVYAVLVLYAGPRLLRPLASRCQSTQGLKHSELAWAMLFLFASAYATEKLGIHPLFGAFLAGIATPRDFGFSKAVAKRLEDLTVVLLLPMFFAYSGLKTHLGLLNGAEMWMYFVAIVVVAVIGKLGGAAFAARSTGMTWRESTALGALVNTRGLVELVVLNIGLDNNIISPPLFAMMVLMAIVTTIMTVPLIDWIYPPHARTPTPVPAPS